MGNREYYEMKLEVIRAIEDDKIETPHHIPVGIYAQEAASLYYWALDDKDALAAVGLPPELVDDLPIRIEALKEASAYWDNYRNAEKKNAREWKTRAPLAYNLRKRLLTDFRHAFQDHPQQMKAVRNIAKGKSHDKMIRALNDLGVLGKKISCYLRPSISIRPSWIKQFKYPKKWLNCCLMSTRKDGNTRNLKKSAIRPIHT